MVNLILTVIGLFKTATNKVCSFFKGIYDFFAKKVTVSTGVLTTLYTIGVSSATFFLSKFFKNKKGEAYVDTGVKILIAVVIGALLLALLYALFNDTIMPSVTEKVEELFDYAG